MIDLQAYVSEKEAAGLAAKDAIIAARDATIVTLQAQLAACLEGTPVDPPPPPPPPPTGSFSWQGKDTPQLTKAYMQANTGPRIALTSATSNNVSGIVKGKSFAGTVLPANGTAFEDCEIVINGNAMGIDGHSKTYTMQNCRVRATGNSNRQQGVLGNFTATACDVSGFEDGFRPTGAHTLRACWVHDLSTAPDAHNDGIQAFSGPGLIEQNRIEARDTSAVMVQSITNSANNAPGGVIVRHNYLSGGVPLRIESECKGKGCQAYENAIVRGAFNLYWDVAGVDVFYGNIDAVSGAAI